MLTSTLRLTICLALAGGVLAAVAAPAQAANIAPNSEFANCTGGVPDQWSAATGSQIACVNDGNGDTTGVSLTDPGDNSFIETMVSACIAPTGGIAPGLTPASYAYKSQATVPSSGHAQLVPGTSLVATFYSSSNCAPGTELNSLDPNVNNENTTTRPWNTWLTESGTITVPQGTISMTLSFTYGWGVGSSGRGPIFVDDIVFDVAPATAVTLRSLSAVRGAKGVTVRWRTASEVETLGFHVYREVNGKRVRVNRTLIAGKGRGSYSFLDPGAPRGKTVRYWIQEVAADGSRSWYGPARVART